MTFFRAVDECKFCELEFIKMSLIRFCKSGNEFLGLKMPLLVNNPKFPGKNWDCWNVWWFLSTVKSMKFPKYFQKYLRSVPFLVVHTSHKLLYQNVSAIIQREFSIYSWLRLQNHLSQYGSLLWHGIHRESSWYKAKSENKLAEYLRHRHLLFLVESTMCVCFISQETRENYFITVKRGRYTLAFQSFISHSVSWENTSVQLYWHGKWFGEIFMTTIKRFTHFMCHAVCTWTVRRDALFAIRSRPLENCYAFEHLSHLLHKVHLCSPTILIHSFWMP